MGYDGTTGDYGLAGWLRQNLNHSLYCFAPNTGGNPPECLSPDYWYMSYVKLPNGVFVGNAWVRGRWVQPVNQPGNWIVVQFWRTSIDINGPSNGPNQIGEDLMDMDFNITNLDYQAGPPGAVCKHYTLCVMYDWPQTWFYESLFQ